MASKSYNIKFTGSEAEVDQAAEALHKFLAVYSPEFLTIEATQAMQIYQKVA